MAASGFGSFQRLPESQASSIVSQAGSGRRKSSRRQYVRDQPLLDLIQITDVSKYPPNPVTGDTPLHLAAAAGDNQAILVLGRSKYRIKTLARAKAAGDMEAVSILNRPTYRNSERNFKQETPLFLAIRNSHHEAQMIMLNFDRAPRKVFQSQSSIVYVRDQPFLDLIRTTDVSKYPPNPQSKNTPLHLAAAAGDVPAILVLTRFPYREIALVRAQAVGDMEAVSILSRPIYRIDNQNVSYQTPLLMAAQNSHPEAILTLIDLGADPLHQDRDHLTAIHYAAMYGDTATIQILSRYPKLFLMENDFGDIPLGLAIKGQQYPAAELLIRLSPDSIRFPGGSRRTPLHLLAIKGNLELINLLISVGNFTSSDLDVKDKKGFTALALAAKFKHPAVIEFLVSHGSLAIDHANKEGRMPLHLAVETGDIPTVETLLRLGSQSLDHPDLAGRTPFMVAVMRGNIEMVEALIRFGSQAIDIPNRQLMTPLQVAANNSNIKMVEKLIQLGSQAVAQYDSDGRMPIHTVSALRIKNAGAMIELLVRTVREKYPEYVQGYLDYLDKFSRPPLYYAVIHMNLEAIKTLLALGANPEFNYTGIPKYALENLNPPMTPQLEQEIEDIRWRVYFRPNVLGSAMMSQLLGALS